MGYGGQPYIVYQHNDIVSVRVDLQGRKLAHDFEARRSTEILRGIEQAYGLRPVIPEQERTPELKAGDYPRGNLKQQLSSAVRAAISKYGFASVREFNTLLNRYNAWTEECRGGSPTPESSTGR